MIRERGEGHCLNCGHADDLAAMAGRQQGRTRAGGGTSPPRVGNALAGGPPELSQATRPSAERAARPRSMPRRQGLQSTDGEYSPNTRLYGVGYRLLGLTVPEICTLIEREHGRCRPGELDCSCLHTVVAVIPGDRRLAECRYCGRLWRPAERAQKTEFVLAFDLSTEGP